MIGILKASHIWTKRAAFFGGLDVQHAREACGWLATMPTTWPSRRASAAYMMLLGPALVDLQVVAVVDEFLDDLRHVVRPVAVRRDEVQEDVERRSAGSGQVACGGFSRLFCGKHRQEAAYFRDAGLLVVVGEVTDTGGLRVDVGAAEPVLGDLLAGDRLLRRRLATNICEVLTDDQHEFVSAGEYAAPPAHGPEHHADLRMTPEARVLRCKMPP